MAAAVNSG